MKTLSLLLRVIGFIIIMIFSVAAAFMIHSYIGWISVGIYIMFLGQLIIAYRYNK